MGVALVTGSGGLVGSEASRYFASLGLDVVGIDNDMRRVFFGDEASTAWNVKRLQSDLRAHYEHHAFDVRDNSAVENVMRRYGSAIQVVVHTAAQPSHDWAAREPATDFSINAGGTLNVLEATRHHAPDAVVIFTSTNKVYGDRPNLLPLVELPTRYEIEPGHPYAGGIDEEMSIDTTLHSIFGASKVAADVLVQEYGRYFGMATACFRGGTLTGPSHSGTELHGFLAYLMRCTVKGDRYSVFGYKGKQVRDAIHSSDLVRAFGAFFGTPRSGAVYNIGGGRTSNCSVLEGIDLCQTIAARELDWSYVDENRVGDHIWWIGSNARFESDYPEWRMEYDVERILKEIYEANFERWSA
jgi:CDP-paratose 2-epimerase